MTSHTLKVHGIDLRTQRFKIVNRGNKPNNYGSLNSEVILDENGKPLSYYKKKQLAEVKKWKEDMANQAAEDDNDIEMQ